MADRLWRFYRLQTGTQQIVDQVDGSYTGKKASIGLDGRKIQNRKLIPKEKGDSVRPL